MQTILDSADQPAHDAFVEKKSEFIGDACHINSLDEALAFVQMIRDQHPKARHVAMLRCAVAPTAVWLSA